MLHRIGDNRAGSNDYIDLARNHVGNQIAQPLDTAVGIPVLDDDVATFVVAQLAQALLEARLGCRAVAALGAYPEIADMGDRLWYLCTGGHRSKQNSKNDRRECCKPH